MTHLTPIWRCYPNGTGVGALALDPREAAFVIARGWALLDGKRYRAKLADSGSIAGDGRVAVRIEALHR